MGNLLVTSQLGTSQRQRETERQRQRDNFQTNKQDCKMLRTVMTTLVSCLWLAVLASAKFCPGEKNGNQCVAGSGAYKCAVFFEDLTPKRHLTWIGALPDALKKARNKDEVAEILGADVTQASFKQLESCDNVTANARCYTILDKQRKLPLDSCDRNLINTRGTDTVGDYLCGQVRRWLRNSEDFKENGIRDLKLPVYYSACNNEWTPVSDGDNDLYVEEPLCCDKNGKFFRCDGTDFTETC